MVFFGCYLSPDNAVTIKTDVAVIVQRPRGVALLMAGDFNTNLSAPEGISHEEYIVAE